MKNEIQRRIFRVINQGQLSRFVHTSSLTMTTNRPNETTPASVPTASSNEDVIFHKIDTKRVIVLNRPKALNALNLSMIQKIYPKLKKYNSDSSSNVNLVVIKGEGDKAFCAGGDVRAIYEAKKVNGSLTADFFREEYKLNYLIGTLKIPYVALIDGVTMGGGVGLSVHGMFRVATERTMFAMPEMAIGLFPDVGGTHFLPRLRGKLGTFLALTGHRLIGRDVLEAGIATHFVNSSLIKDLEKQLLLMKSETVQKDSVNLLLSEFQIKSKTIASKPHQFNLAPHLKQIDELFSGRSVEEIISNLEKDNSDWSKKQLGIMAKFSPTSMKVALRQCQIGGKLDLKHCLETEYRLTQRFMDDTDFHEGVRAVLVDKTNDPKWKPDSLAKVSDEKIDYYFSKLPNEKELVLE